ncbi:glycoside hydrolase family 3 protein [Propionicicella superfundia]|uniref:glycoside hydrolase family 3 protein n=1 Tax=Propionicicella superfundia TaxID=348582 RepID=UPI000419D282|nr:glycoside hydrolase family 3 N-terminal domain-containing protein [Propionicicella superfundia]
MTNTIAAGLPYQDPTLPVEQRVDDLLSRLSLEDKAGLMFQTMTGYGDISQGDPVFGLPSLTSMVTKRRMNHFNVIGSASAREMAVWHNAAQELAAGTGFGIPITFSTDPRHGFTDNPGAAMLAGPFSQWPETLGLAALRDEALVRRFADIARQEYLAVGIRVALHPQIDVMTEPRWARCSGTFGEDAELTGRLGAAYIRGFQGVALGTESVAAMTKHFPGGGPQKDGEDPHFDYGKDQVYPGDNFEYHLRPFIAAIEAGSSQMMPYYGRPVGTPYDEVAFGFNKGVLTDLLRDRLGFTGIICTDWGLLTDAVILGQEMPARAWGVEHLTREERVVLALEAGVDQFGGELCPEVVVAVVRDGRVSEDRLDVSVRRLLREKFVLGLFDARQVDVAGAEIVVGNAEFREAGLAAQRASVTLLANDSDGPARLPLAAGLAVYCEGIDPAAVAGHARPVSDPAQADVAIIRVKAPFEPRSEGFESFFHAGSLEFPAEQVEHLREVCEAVPTVLDVYLDRPAVLGPLPEWAGALTVTHGTSDAALVDVLFGVARPEGRLPFDLPRSMAAVVASREDVPFDTADPVYRFGDGLSY